MKDQHDNKTVDWCRSQHAVAQGEKMIVVLSHMLSKSGKSSVADVLALVGGTKRSVQRYLDQLTQAGYVQRDDASPAGFTATNKTKQLFGVKG
ncbi:hypothetical protein [Acinetobacter sp. YH12086]|uniref:hypothetical protein n=1 Tax=Acinetobacter sp. YH12086 TaxID=2601078 RepID=UPI0015D1E8F2|nr:hypothetical protein [Acinetobacter sp. YH12086]